MWNIFVQHFLSSTNFFLFWFLSINILFMQTPCCNKFYKCRFCHDENETHHFDRKTLTELICSECNTRQTVREQCENCGVRFGKVSSWAILKYIFLPIGTQKYLKEMSSSYNKFSKSIVNKTKNSFETLDTFFFNDIRFLQ